MKTALKWLLNLFLVYLVISVFLDVGFWTTLLWLVLVIAGAVAIEVAEQACRWPRWTGWVLCGLWGAFLWAVLLR